MTIEKNEGFISKAVNTKITRRSFLKWSAALGATSTMTGLVAQTGLKVASAASQTGATGVGGDVDEWVGTRCLMCHSVCYLACGVTKPPTDGEHAGILRKIEGYGGQWKMGATTPTAAPNGNVWDMIDDANYPPVGGLGSTGLGYAGATNSLGEGYLPYAQHNRGRVCAKGNNGMEHLYDPDRVKYPLEKTGDRGDNKFRKVSWDYALKYMANVLRELAGYTGAEGYYDLGADGDYTLYALGTAGKNFGPVSSARGADYRHRFIHFVGRNESDKGGAQFSGAYGTPNHIEHTSLCELSRHVAQRTLWGHHWSIPDLNTHKVGKTLIVPDWAGGTTAYTMSADNDCDLMIEIGGNPLEAKIPSASYSVHWGDRRRANHVGATATAGSAKGRIITIDVRQSNTAAFSDEWIRINSGADGALALAMFRYLVQTIGTLKAEVDAGHLSGKYFGLFTAEEGTATGIPAGGSLESYVNSAAYASSIGAASTVLTDVLSATATVTGIDAETIVYLARALGGLDCSGGWPTFPAGSWVVGGTAVVYKSAVIDGYRGPAKHSNGAYNYRAIRALNVVAANKYADDVAGGGGRGGISTLGGLWADGHSSPAGYSNGNIAWGFGGVSDTWGAGATTKAVSHEIDLWDYENQQERWRFLRGFKWNDQNLIPAVRYFNNMHPYVVGLPCPSNYKGPEAGSGAVPGPSTDWNYEADYKPEAMLLWKNAPAYARPNIDLDIELFTKKVSGQYVLKHLWSIDCFMGDGTRFCDLILPDTTYLERYDFGDDFWYSQRHGAVLRQPVVQDRYETAADSGVITPRHLFDARSIRAITYQLARLIQPSKDDATKSFWGTGGLYKQYSWHPGDLGSIAANIAGSVSHVNDGEVAAEQWALEKCSGGTLPTNATFTTGKLWMMGNSAGLPGQRAGMGVAAKPMQQPDWWSGSWGGNQGALTTDSLGKKRVSTNSAYRRTVALPGAIIAPGGKIQFYNPNVAEVEDKGGNLFNGTPIYEAIAQQTSGTFPLRLTTYKLNVHTQSRTACNPRQQEIIGNNWCVMHPADADARGIVNGDRVRVTSVQSGPDGIEIEAKVTPKAGIGHVHISHSQGHDAKSFGGDGKGTGDGYLVDYGSGPLPNRLDPGDRLPGGAIDLYRNTLLPSAPSYKESHGTHANKVITRWTEAAGQSTDALGGSVAWFDTAVEVVKV